MGVSDKKKESEHAAGAEFAAVLPRDGKSWYQTAHIIKLNLLLMIPLLSSATVGYDGSMMNGLQILTWFKRDFNNPAGAVLGLINAVYPLGKVIALFVVTPVADRYGRKIPMAIGLVGCIVFAILQGLSPNLASFVVARAFLGFFTSFISQPSPVLIAELAYPTQRGKLTSLYNTFFYFGAIFAAWLTFGTFKIDSTWSWRIPSIVQGAIPVLQLTALWFVPESPRYLVSRGRSDETRRDLIRYHAGGDVDSPLVAFEMSETERAIAAENESYSANSWLDLVRGAANRKRTLIAVIVGFFSQWNGVGVVSYYLTLVLNTIGIRDPKDQTLINGMLQIFNWLMATFAGAMMVDRLGRRTLFLISTAGMLVSYICWTGLTSGFVATEDARMGRAVLAFIFIFYFFYDIAWTPLLQAYPVEIYPYTLRSRGLSLTLITSFTGLIVGNQVNPIAMGAIQWKYYIVFCCLLLVLLLLVYFLFPETKGRTLEEIREVFEGPATPTAMSLKAEEAAGEPAYGDGQEKLMQSKHVESAK
ncbi:hypothetical protein RB597_010002 [Gaeumannomyces tritici]